MNEEHKNFREKEMRDLEREREKSIFRGNNITSNINQTPQLTQACQNSIENVA